MPTAVARRLLLFFRPPPIRRRPGERRRRRRSTWRGPFRAGCSSRSRASRGGGPRRAARAAGTGRSRPCPAPSGTCTAGPRTAWPRATRGTARTVSAGTRTVGTWRAACSVGAGAGPWRWALVMTRGGMLLPLFCFWGFMTMVVPRYCLFQMSRFVYVPHLQFGAGPRPGGLM